MKLLGQDISGGDRVLWIIAILLMLFSILPVYSASSNLAFLSGSGNTGSALGKHFGLLVSGVLILIFTQLVPYRYYGRLSMLLLPITILLLFYTMIFGVNISNATRWIRIPYVQYTFQTSALAYLVLPVFLARNLVKMEAEKLHNFRSGIFPLLFPIALTCGLVLPSNFSSAALLFGLSLVTLYIGGYRFRNILAFLGIAIVGLALYLLTSMAFPNLQNRYDTWVSRIESFTQPEQEEQYQVTRAKMALAEGEFLGKGPGKSIHKNFLPQSNSDFIYAIIVEEYGTLGGLLIVFLYVILLIRILVIANKARTPFGSLLCVALGIMLSLQAFTNLAVAVNLFPVTGQTLPLISAGGSSIWTTSAALGIIISVSRYQKEEKHSADPGHSVTDPSTSTTSGSTGIDPQNDAYA